MSVHIKNIKNFRLKKKSLIFIFVEKYTKIKFHATKTSSKKYFNIYVKNTKTHLILLSKIHKKL